MAKALTNQEAKNKVYEDKWSKEAMEILCKHFQESERNVCEYLQILIS